MKGVEITFSVEFSPLARLAVNHAFDRIGPAHPQTLEAWTKATLDYALQLVVYDYERLNGNTHEQEAPDAETQSDEL